MSGHIINSTQYIYLIWNYDEHGPENLMVSLDRDNISNLFKCWCKRCIEEVVNEYSDKNLQKLTIKLSKERAKLKVLLLKSDSELEGKNEIGEGWGCFNLQVVQLGKINYEGRERR